MKTPQIIDVRITPQKDTTFVVTPVWSDVDRPDSMNWGIPKRGAKGRALAERFAKAIWAGAAFTNVKVKKDIYDKTYVDFDCQFSGSDLDGSLTQLGF